MRKNQVTIKDIAKLLNISPSTVSRALKNHPDISISTRQKVQDLAKELKYKPNAIARSLRQSKTNVIGVIIPQVVHHFFSSVISGIEDLASKNNYNVLMCQSGESVEKEIQNIQTLIGSRVDGIIISKTKNTIDCAPFKSIIDSDIPLVFFDRTCQGIETDSVVIDDFHAAYNATEYLIKSGKQNIMHFAGPEHLGISKQRIGGYQKALKDNGLSANNNLIIRADNFEDAKSTMTKLIKENKLPDAVFAVNDNTAAGIIVTLKKYNINIPEQVAVIGFTNSPISTITDPPLTTVEQNGFEMGYKAAEILLERIIGEQTEAYKKEYIPTKLIIRKST